MGVSVADFKEAHPEFVSTDDDLVETALADALLEIDAAVWGEKADKGQRLLAAHLLAMGPFGVQAGMRLGAGANQTSCYFPEYDRLAKKRGTAHRPVLA